METEWARFALSMLISPFSWANGFRNALESLPPSLPVCHRPRPAILQCYAFAPRLLTSRRQYTCREDWAIIDFDSCSVHHS
uniref:Putative secreted protein n=1 Tax=Anopheles marajoara TaxID=58244 RepID=A0A2M4CCL9_9DIPT